MFLYVLNDALDGGAAFHGIHGLVDRTRHHLTARGVYPLILQAIFVVPVCRVHPLESPLLSKVVSDGCLRMTVGFQGGQRNRVVGLLAYTVVLVQHRATQTCGAVPLRRSCRLLNTLIAQALVVEELRLAQFHQTEGISLHRVSQDLAEARFFVRLPSLVGRVVQL